ncbi:NAD-dependent epimerase/dehydratase family protein [Massilia sp. W12]|uniref:NAD-dependent epimerase/dehydratase family protein n=1 Tax=Massilia sp. W12 TaxID=3126507 RepID=UPI0030D2F5BF
MRILVTGAQGFVGAALCASLRQQGHQVMALARRPAPDTICLEMGPQTDWSPHLAGVEAIVHCAARVHLMQDAASDPLAAYRAANCAATLQLARAAAAAGVQRFVFLSSIKVNGEESAQAYRADTPPAPQDPYGVSKWEAEQGLLALAQRSALQVCIIRPPLIYGAGVKANFRQLLNLVRRGLPLPLANIDNRRSLLYLGNLLDLISLCLQHPQAANRTFLASDGEDVSTPQLIRTIAAAQGRSVRLLPCPPALLALVCRLLGRSSAWQRLAGSLQVDSSAARDLLGWTPPYSMARGLQEMLAAEQASH